MNRTIVEKPPFPSTSRQGPAALPRRAPSTPGRPGRYSPAAGKHSG